MTTVKEMRIFHRQAISLRLMTDVQKATLVSNIVEAMQGVPEKIQLRQMNHFYQADPQYGLNVAQGLGLTFKP